MKRCNLFSSTRILFILILILSAACKVKTVIPEEIMLKDNWKVFTTGESKADGKIISSPGYQHDKVYQTTVPNTVLAVLVENDVYTDIFFADNFDKIPEEPFMDPWWYRTTFNLSNKANHEIYRLVFEGINYRANVWLNGQIIASSDTMEGSFRIFDFDVTNHVKKGENVLAVEIIPPKDQELTIGFVDWNPWPPDQNMGIWRPVKLLKSGSVSMNHLYVNPNLDTETFEASLYVSAELTNNSDKEISGNVSGKIEANVMDLPDHERPEDILFEKSFVLKPHEKKKIEFSREDFPQLNIQEPRIWWPNTMGDPDLYRLNVSASIGKNLSDQKSTRFGIRRVEDYINEEGHRGYKINGKKVLTRGGGWVDDVLLADDDKKVEDQIKYVRHMGLNTIRLEGFWGRNKKIYECADENGILVMIGLSCQWEWEGYCGRQEDDKYMSIFSPEDIALHARGYMDQVVWLRNHPSVFLWVYGSDKLLVPDMERELNEFLAEEDPSRPVLGSCKYNVSDISGPTAVKMLGPYAYVTPNYWYEDTENGGAYGFNTETGPGIQPSPIESLRKMIPEESLWPINDIWRHHLGRNEFNKFDRWLPAFNKRYGEEDNVEDFAFKAQMSNYEAIRPMFEAFAVNKYNATGVIQWMLNSAIPGMLWQLYDWYLMPNGAFYGTKKACNPLNIVYNYKDGNIYLTSENAWHFEDFTAQVRIFNADSREMYNKSITVSMEENSSKMIHEIPDIKNLSTTYFLDLKLLNQQGNVLQDNFYWLSTKKDVLDFENTRWFFTPNKAYADFNTLNDLPETEIMVNHEFTDMGGKKGLRVKLENPTDKIAFFIELTLFDQSSGDVVLPVFWNDNYISLLPGEVKTIEGTYREEDLAGNPGFRYKGWNVK